ncbi:MAG: phage tail protein [Caulobacter sp.]|nr:phage tail protein [Caulobacter sp.]
MAGRPAVRPGRRRRAGRRPVLDSPPERRRRRPGQAHRQEGGLILPISFNTIPVNIRTPGQYVEFDASRARKGLPKRTPRVLLLGQKLAGGSALNLTLTRIVSPAGALASWGAGSMLAQMSAAFLKANPSAEVWGLSQADDAAGTYSTWTVTLTGPATSAGAMPLLIGGRQVNTAIASGNTAAQAATAMAAAVTAASDMPVTAAGAGDVLTLTARHKGLAGAGIDVRVRYYEEDAVPSGLTAVVAAGVVGATDPATAAAIAAIGDEQFDLIVTPFISSANLTALEAELEARWGPTRQQDGLAIISTRGTSGSLASFGDGRNSQFVCCLPAKAPPNLSWEWAATTAGIVAHYGYIDPARPFQTLTLPGLLPPAEADRFTRAERELLLRDGVSTFTVDAGGKVNIERLVTMYQEDAGGNADTAYLNLNTLLILSYARWTLRLRFAQKFPRHKLGSDSDLPRPNMVTPKVARAELIAWARDLEAEGIFENIDQFIADLQVERDESNVDQLNALIPPDLVNQLIVFAAQIQFRL